MTPVGPTNVIDRAGACKLRAPALHRWRGQIFPVLKMMDPYAVLDVSPTATPAEITHAYRRKLHTHHPDTRSQASPAGADERLRDILAAYAVLRDPKRRADYDRTLDPTAHPDAQSSGSIQVQVDRSDGRDRRPPLWAGPVRWHR